uniref:Uncharacterized protein n=1 Tax=Arundo donax TaxID=35708 RepID=A0A0A9FTB7_ARUDO
MAHHPCMPAFAGQRLPFSYENCMLTCRTNFFYCSLFAARLALMQSLGF